MAQKTKIVVVIVLYKTLVEDSISYLNYCKYKHLLKCDQQLIIFNNSPEITVENKGKAIIVNSTENKHLNIAYNFALKTANESHANWVLLLDSDSQLTEEYFIELSQSLNSNIDRDIVSIIPSLTQNNKTISPHSNQLLYLNCKPIGVTGVIRTKATAFNSLSLLRVSFLNDIQGFSSKYPLDMLDYWVYYQVFKRKKSILLLDAKIEHDLSVLNFEEKMTEARYKNLILAEKIFFRELPFSYQLAYRIKLLMRAAKQYVFFKNKTFSKITINHLIK